MVYKLLTYRSADGLRAGVVCDGLVYDAERLIGDGAYATVLGILENWDAAEARLEAAVAAGRFNHDGWDIDAVEFGPPIWFPGQIWAAGANYDDHIAEMSEEDQKYKAVNAKKVSGGRAWHFVKTSRSSLVAHKGDAKLPDYSKMVDWEVELAVVIGRPAKDVKASDALSYVAGYTIANDLSARDFVAREGIADESPFRFDWLSHKGFDQSCPMGPWIVPAKQVSDPHALDLKLWIDDELMQSSNTRHMIFSIGEQIEEISARTTMHPGDVILTGTPSGVGMSRNRFLESGQTLRLEIDEIGVLSHTVS